jgi:N-acetylmuramoyl-L-alanine amidase
MFAIQPKRCRRLLRSLCLDAVAIGLALALWAPHTALAAEIVHVVQPGENLYRIGLHYGVGWQAIMAANGLYSTYIHVGQALVIPGTTAGTEPAAPPPAPTPPPAAPAPVQPAAVYVVQRGDSLWLIAQRFQVTVGDLMQANGLSNGHLIYAGQVLAIGGPVPAAGKTLNVTGRRQ